MNAPIFKQDEQGIAIEKIMDDNVPGWREKVTNFETFALFCDWVDSCVRGIVLHGTDRKDH